MQIFNRDKVSLDIISHISTQQESSLHKVSSAKLDKKVKQFHANFNRSQVENLTANQISTEQEILLNQNYINSVNNLKMSSIVGKKISNAVQYSIDGQIMNDRSLNDDIQTIRQQEKQKPKITQKLLMNDKPKENKINSQNQQNKKKPKPTQVKQATITDKSPIVNPTKTPKQIECQDPTPVIHHSQTIQQKKFQPLNEQFPNLTRTLTQPIPNRKKYVNQDSEYSESPESSYTEEESDYISDDASETGPLQQDQSQEKGQEIVEYEEKLYRNPPDPQRHPNQSEFTKQNVDQIVKKNNKLYVLSKSQIRQQKEQEKQKLLLKREQMKKYGKQQIVRTHHQKDAFENKFQWGQNQNRVKEETQRQNKLQQEQEKEKLEKDKRRPQLKEKQELINQLFSDNVGKTSKFSRIWKLEARSASRKKNYSLSKDRHDKGYQSEPERRSEEKHQQKSAKKSPRKDRNEVLKMIETNAQKVLQAIQAGKIESKQKQLIKKHRINYIDREAKTILKNTKKYQVPFQPSKVFENKPQSASEQFRPEEHTSTPKTQDRKIPQHSYNEQRQIESNQLNMNIADGRVISKKEYKDFIKINIEKQRKNEKVKKSLNHSKLKFKPSDPLTKEEQKAKQELGKLVNLKDQVEQNIKQSKFAKQQVQVQLPQNEIANYILSEAQLPDMNKDYEPEQSQSNFRKQVEAQIKESISQQRKKKKPIKQKVEEEVIINRKPQQKQDDIYEMMKMYEIDPDMPPPTILRKQAIKIKELKNNKIKRVFKSQEPKQIEVTEPRHPLYHDLGETYMFEDDMYNAEHKSKIGEVRPLSLKTKEFKNDSDSEDERNFVVKSGFYRNNDQKREPALRELKPNYPQDFKKNRNKSVTFKDGYKTDESSDALRNQYSKSQRQLEDIIKKQGIGNDLIFKRQRVENLISDKVKGKQTTDDSDDAYIINYSRQMWSQTDPLSRDIFVLSSKDLMNMPELHI